MPPKLFLTVAAGSCVLLLILSGANGLALVPPLVLWLLYIAAVNWQLNTVTSKRCALVLMAFAVVAVALVGLYFVGYNRVPYHPSTHRPRIVVRTAAQFLTMGFGPGVVGLGFDHRTPMFFWPFVCALIVGLFLVTGGLLLVTRWKHPDQRPQATGFFLFLGAMASLALAIGLGRDGFEPRYITLSLPGICAVYLVWIKYGQRLKNIVPAMLMVVVLVVFVPDTLWGWRYAVDLNSRLSSFERDIKTGMPPYQLICNYSSLHPHHEIMMDYMPMLRDAHAGAFSNLRDNPPFQKYLPLTPGQYIPYFVGQRRRPSNR